MAARRLGREQALQALYGIAVGKREPSEAVDEVINEKADTEHRLFVADLVYGTLRNAQDSDALLTPHLQEWTIDRLAAIDRIILQMAAFEIVHVPTMPQAVVINEAVELAKRFSTDDSAGFINGVLGSVVRGRISS